jgi:hypothetical protein
MPRSPLARLRRDGAARSVSALVALWALLLQLAVPLAHDPLGIGTFTPWLDAPLCHAGIAATIPSAPGTPLPADTQSHLCPLCVALQACGSFIMPLVGAGLAAIVLPALPPAPLPAGVRLTHAPGFTAQSRAPPAA